MTEKSFIPIAGARDLSRRAVLSSVHLSRPAITQSRTRRSPGQRQRKKEIRSLVMVWTNNWCCPYCSRFRYSLTIQWSQTLFDLVRKCVRNQHAHRTTLWTTPGILISMSKLPRKKDEDLEPHIPQENGHHRKKQPKATTYYVQIKTTSTAFKN